MVVVEERVDRLEEAFARFLDETSRILAEIRADIADIREFNQRTDRQLLILQRQAEKDRQQADQDRQQAERERKDFNRRLAEVTDSQGLMIETMVWPNLKRIASQVFGDDVVVTQAIRIKRTLPQDRRRMKEIDLLAASLHAVIVCEAKSKPTSEKTRDFLTFLEDFKEFFHEYRELRIIPMVASIAFDPSLVSFMTSQGVLALGFGDETMKLLNPEAAGCNP